MDKAELLKKLKVVEQFAASSKLSRLLSNPYKYMSAILFRELSYKMYGRPRTVSTKTFYGKEMEIVLPSSTDIYLAGAKTHDSEIRLTRFLIQSLGKGDTFLDVGAHYGFYTLLAAKLIGNTGIVYSFEASARTFEVLKRNTAANSTIHAFHNAVYDESTSLEFYEFPNLYAEYNTLDASQFKGSKWFQNIQPEITEVKTIVLDELLSERSVIPNLVKIDVEGAEFKALKGMRKHLDAHSPVIAMEYLSHERGDTAHQKTAGLLAEMNYNPYVILSDGTLKPVKSIPDYLRSQDLESDNIVFKKK